MVVAGDVCLCAGLLVRISVFSTVLGFSSRWLFGCSVLGAVVFPWVDWVRGKVPCHHHILGGRWLFALCPFSSVGDMVYLMVSSSYVFGFFYAKCVLILV